MKRTPLKRTPFKKPDKPYPWRRTPKKEGIIIQKETKDEEWRRIKRDILDPDFIAKGIYNRCELRFSMCIGNALPLHYAHSKKRDWIAKDEPERTREMCEVVRACAKCHDYIEHLEERDGISGHQQMYDIVVSTIERRNKRLARWKKALP